MDQPNIDHISDFPDKLNPMLVKELRQGLRGVSFVILFIAVQAFLCFILLVTAAVASHENAGSYLSQIIFFFFSVAVLVVQPLRGITALSAEIRGDTIDLLSLTKLSAWRITFGKWVSIVSQSGLILTAIVPYLILRYFFGDMQMFAEILLLLSTFLLSATFTAITVGLSGMSSVVIRVLFPISGAFIAFIMIWSMYFGGRNNYQEIIQLVSLTDATTTLTFTGFVSASIYLAWMCLDLGTSMIAPIAENRSSLRRMVSLGLIIITVLAFAFAGVSPFGAIVIGLALCIPISMISLTENPQLVSPIVRPYTRKGTVGKLVGRLLYPGWATGLLYVILLYGVMRALVMFHVSRGAHVGQWDIIVLNSVFAALFFPLALTRIFARKQENRFGLFILFVCTQFLIVLVVFAVESFSSGLHIMPYFFWIPTSFHFLNGPSGIPADTHVYASYFNLTIYAAIALVTTLPVWKHINHVERPTTDDQ
ncbi:MAG: hypothetical protein H7A51_00710 [Akkermansiaceae bacterium]|nr:hypothetical protein [Akkermansiaceae bacterium]